MHIRSESIGPRVKGGARSPALPRAVPAAPHSHGRCRQLRTPALGVIASSCAVRAVTHSRAGSAAHLAHPLPEPPAVRLLPRWE